MRWDLYGLVSGPDLCLDSFLWFKNNPRPGQAWAALGGDRGLLPWRPGALWELGAVLELTQEEGTHQQLGCSAGLVGNGGGIPPPGRMPCALLLSLWPCSSFGSGWLHSGPTLASAPAWPGPSRAELRIEGCGWFWIALLALELCNLGSHFVSLASVSFQKIILY